MRQAAHIVLLVVAALLSACGHKAAVRDTEALYTPRYAEGFSIERDKASGAKLLCVKNPWQGAEDIRYYYPIDTLAPKGRIIAMSSSYAAMLDVIGCADRIVGLSGCHFIYTPSIRQAVERGEIAEVGYDAAFDFEMIRSLGADLVLLYGVTGEAKSITAKLDELAIPYLYIGDYLENSPLGKAEWMVAIASICGVEERGKAVFSDIEERYNALRSTKHCSAYRPRVMLNLPYRDTWFMPPANSYMVRLIEDAGGEYILTESNDSNDMQSRSIAISLEEALVYASRADFWINLGQIASLDELRAAAPRFANIEAVRSKRIYNNTKRTNESRGSDFWESGTVRPDLILSDLINIIHYEAPTDSLHYYKQLN